MCVCFVLFSCVLSLYSSPSLLWSFFFLKGKDNPGSYINSWADEYVSWNHLSESPLSNLISSSALIVLLSCRRNAFCAFDSDPVSALASDQIRCCLSSKPALVTGLGLHYYGLWHTVTLKIRIPNPVPCYGAIPAICHQVELAERLPCPSLKGGQQYCENHSWSRVLLLGEWWL